MILISASDNNSWRHYRLRALAKIRAWGYALRACSDATLGREAEPEAEQGDIRCFSSPDLHIRPTQESETSPSGMMTPAP